MKRVVILHGYGASPESHWFPWLADQLRAPDVDVVIPHLPDSGAPRVEPWLRTTTDALGEPDESLIVVAHSLGSITALRALAAKDPVRLGGILLVSGFAEPLPKLPEIDAFTDALPTFSAVLGDTPILVIASDDDGIVPTEHSARLAQLLGAEFVIVPGGGHFLAEDGWTTLPQARDWLRSLLHD